MKKIMNIFIVLAILRITYQYVETVGIYQAELLKAEMINVHNDVLIKTVTMEVRLYRSDIMRLINNRRKYGKAIDIYFPLLAEYERAWEDKDHYDEHGFIMSDYRFRSLSNSGNSFGHKELCYALADLADDGSVELVIGVEYDGEYIITTIYSYDGDSIYCADTGVDGDRTLYETGVYEVHIGMREVGLFEYYQFKEDMPQAEFVIGLTQYYGEGKYYKNTELENSDNIEITEEEFRKIREQYEKSLIELEWQELEGYDRLSDIIVSQEEISEIMEISNTEKLPEVYYRILNNGMAVEGEGREYTKDEIMADSEMLLVFRTILCGYFEDIPWGDITLDEEKDIYYEEYQNKETWQFLLKDLDGDDREELMIRNEEGRLMIFYEQWGDMEGTEGRFYWCTMGEGDECFSIREMLHDEHNEADNSYLGDIYLENGLLASFSKLMRNGHTDIYIDIQKGTVSGTKQDLEKCWIRTINNYEEYQSYLKYYKISYDDNDDRSKMTHNGTYYFIDGEMVSGEDVEAWLEEKVWQQMIPAEEWGIVP